MAFAVILKCLHDVPARSRGPACRQSNGGRPSGRSFGTTGSGVLGAWRRPWIFRLQAGLWGRAAVTTVGGVCPEGPMPDRRGGRGPPESYPWSSGGVQPILWAPVLLFRPGFLCLLHVVLRGRCREASVGVWFSCLFKGQQVDTAVFGEYRGDTGESWPPPALPPQPQEPTARKAEASSWRRWWCLPAWLVGRSSPSPDIALSRGRHSVPPAR